MSPVDPTSATAITPEWAKQALPGAPGLDPATTAPTATQFVGDPDTVYRRLERLNTAPLRDIVREAKLLQDLNLFDEREATLLSGLAEKRGKELIGELQALDGPENVLRWTAEKLDNGEIDEQFWDTVVFPVWERKRKEGPTGTIGQDVAEAFKAAPRIWDDLVKGIEGLARYVGQSAGGTAPEGTEFESVERFEERTKGMNRQEKTQALAEFRRLKEEDTARKQARETLSRAAEQGTAESYRYMLVKPYRAVRDFLVGNLDETPEQRRELANADLGFVRQLRRLETGEPDASFFDLLPAVLGRDERTWTRNREKLIGAMYGSKTGGEDPAVLTAQAEAQMQGMTPEQRTQFLADFRKDRENLDYAMSRPNLLIPTWQEYTAARSAARQKLTEEQRGYVAPVGEILDLSSLVPVGVGAKAALTPVSRVAQQASRKLAGKGVRPAVVAAESLGVPRPPQAPLRAAVGGAMERTGKVLEDKAQGPLVRAGLAAAGAAAAGAEPTGILLSAVLSNAPGARRLSTAVPRALQMAGKALKYAPPGPISTLASIAVGTGRGAAAGTLSMIPSAYLGGETSEERGTLLAGGAVFGGAAAAPAATGNAALELGRSYWTQPGPEPAQRRQIATYGTNYDAAHAAAVGTLGNREANSVEGLRDMLAQLTAGKTQLYVLNNDDYNALSSRIPGVERSQGVFLAPTGEVFVRLGGESLRHEVGHALDHALEQNFPQVREQLVEAVANAYSANDLIEMRDTYEALMGRELSAEDLVREVLAENFQAVLNGAPIDRLGTPSTLAQKVYQTMGLIGERLGLRSMGTGGPVATSETLQFTPSFEVVQAISNALSAAAMSQTGQPAVAAPNAPAAPAPAPAAPAAPVQPAPAAAAPAPAPVAPAAPAPAAPAPAPVAPVRQVWAKVNGQEQVLEAVPNPDGTWGWRYTYQTSQGQSTVFSNSNGASAADALAAARAALETDLAATASSAQTAAANLRNRNNPGDAQTAAEYERDASLTGTQLDKLRGTAAAPASAPTPAAAAPNLRGVTPERRQAFEGPSPELQAQNQKLLDDELAKPQHERVPLRGEYFSVLPGDVRPSELNQVVREKQRELADAADRGGFRNPLRGLFDKVFIPVTSTPGKDGKRNIFAFSYDKLIQNLDILAGWARTTQNPTADSVRKLLDSSNLDYDIRTYLENQANGYAGDGVGLVRPEGTDPKRFPPENPNYKPRRLIGGVPTLNLINILMGLEGVAAEGTSVASQFVRELARLNARTPAATPQQPGKAMKVEFNPLADQLRQAGFDPILLNGVVEQLRIERIGSALEPQTGSPVRAGVQGAIQAGFMPAKLSASAREFLGDRADEFLRRREEIVRLPGDYQVLDENPYKRVASGTGSQSWGEGVNAMSPATPPQLTEKGRKLEALEAEFGIPEWRAKNASWMPSAPPGASPRRVINIGLNVNDGSKLTVEEVLAALERNGLKAIRHETGQSATEPTLIAEIPPGTPETFDRLSAELRQEAVAVWDPASQTGELHGPKAAAWRPFNKDFFIDLKEPAGARFMPRQQAPGERLPGLYSQLLRTLDALPDNATPGQIRAALRDGIKVKGQLVERPVKREEMQDTKNAAGETFESYLEKNPDASLEKLRTFARTLSPKLDVVERREDEGGGFEFDGEVFPTRREAERARDRARERALDAAYEAEYEYRQAYVEGDEVLADDGNSVLYSLVEQDDGTFRITDEHGSDVDGESLSREDAERELDRLAQRYNNRLEIYDLETPDVPDIIEREVQTQYGDYTTRGYASPGYKEIVITAPNAGAYQSPHFGDKDMAEYVMHARVDTEQATTNPQGGSERVYLVEEIQSDRHQKGREVGYSRGKFSPEEEAAAREKYAEADRLFVDAVAKENEARSAFQEASMMLRGFASDELGTPDISLLGDGVIRRVVREAVDSSILDDKTQSEARRLLQAADDAKEALSRANAARQDAFDVMDEARTAVLRGGSTKGVPDAPFKKSWKETAFKYLLADAVDGGAQWFAWTTGETQADRYNLSTRVKRLTVTKQSDGEFIIRGETTAGAPFTRDSIPAADLGDYIGGALKKQVDENLSRGQSVSTFEGDALKVGGHGHRVAYDQILVNYANDLFKRWGQRTQSVKLSGIRGDEATVHAVRITPEVREAVKTGLPLYMPAHFTGKRLAHAVPEKTLTLTHYSAVEGLDVIDPTFMRTGEGARGKKLLAGDPRSFWLVGRGKLKRGDGAAGQTARYEAEVSGARLYDMDRDGLELWEKPQPTIDRTLKEAGYVGFVAKTKDGRRFAAIYEPIPFNERGRRAAERRAREIEARQQELVDKPLSREVVREQAAESKADRAWKQVLAEVERTGEPLDVVARRIGRREKVDLGFMPAPPVDSEAFRKWFGDSKVVDADGKPLVVYHGTNSDFSSFDNSRLGSNTKTLVKGHFFAGSPRLAGQFANREGANIIPAYLSLKNPKVVDAQGRNINAVLGTHEEGMARDNGHDGFIVRNVVDAAGGVMTTGRWSSAAPDTVYIAFEPTQIKSAIGNRGTFDPRDPDIRYMPPKDKSKEHVDRAAIRWRGRVVTGEPESFHQQLIEKLEEQMRGTFQIVDVDDVERGFVSSTGRFLTRKEAFDLARSAGQVGKRSERSAERAGPQLEALNFVRDQGLDPKFMPGQNVELTREELANFMPAPRVDLEDYIDRTAVVLPIDRLAIGDVEVGPEGNRATLSAQGGRGYPLLYPGEGWAFANEATASRFLSRLRAVAGDQKTALVVTSVLNENNLLKSRFGQLATAAAYEAAIGAGLFSRRMVDRTFREVFQRVAASAGELSDADRATVKRIKTLQDFRQAAEAGALTFAAMAEVMPRLDAKKLPIPFAEREAAGLDTASLARDLADEELVGLPTFSLVSLMEIPVDQKPSKDERHVSYPWGVKGQLLGFFRNPYNPDTLVEDPRVRVRGALSAQPVQTVLPVLSGVRLSERNPNPAERLRGARIPANVQTR